MIPLDAIKSDRDIFERAVAQITPEILGSVIDHTVLEPTAVRGDIATLCREASEIGSFICVNGSRISNAKDIIAFENLTAVRGIAAVIGFPFGAELTEEKVAGARSALMCKGADEVDMVMNVGELRDNGIRSVRNDVLNVAKMVRTASEQTGKKKILKVIQENCSLHDEEKTYATIATSEVAMETGVHMFAKTSTGFGVPKNEETPKGATLDDVYLMNEIVERYRKEGALIGIKAAGGVVNGVVAIFMMLAGGCFDDEIKLVVNPSDVFRIGTSAGKKIVDDFKEKFT